MDIERIPGFNLVLGAPSNWDEVVDGRCMELPVRRDETGFTSQWRPDPRERAQIAAGAPLPLHIVGGSHPPVMLSVGPVPALRPSIANRAPELKSDDNLSRLSVECDFKFTDDGVNGVVEGYGSVFNLMDRGGDIMLPGAFKASLADIKRKKATIPMLWQHDPSMPIGVWNEVSEDEKGLKVKGELILGDPAAGLVGVPQAEIARTLMKKRAVKGLSIGYRTLDYDIDRATGARRLKKVELWEISPVTFPMLPEAQITSVKAANFDARELEDSLREAGLSRSDAKSAVAVLRKQLQRDVGDPGAGLREAATGALMSIRKAAAAISGA